MSTSTDGMDYLGRLYNSFLEVKSESTTSLIEKLSGKVSLIKEKEEGFPEETRETTRILLTVLMLVASAGIQKRIAEKIIDDYMQKK
jgi:hypothetical protein